MPIISDHFNEPENEPDAVLVVRFFKKADGTLTVGLSVPEGTVNSQMIMGLMEVFKRDLASAQVELDAGEKAETV